jgi:uncharacterized protein involved in exopolysaccharide biosynthesis
MKQNIGGLGSLAGLAGINLDMGRNGALTPELYPEIAQSTSFLLKVIMEPVYFEKNDTTVSSFIYFDKVYTPGYIDNLLNYTVGLPSKVRSWFREKPIISSNEPNKNIIRLTSEEDRTIEKLLKRITISVDNKSGILTIKTEMPDAYASAQLAENVVNLLTNEIINYKISKAQQNLEFIQERFDESKKRFELTQKELALFTDRNQNFRTSVAQTEMQRLQNDYNIAFEVYKGLATQLEQAKIKVKEDTPIFTILDAPQVPLFKSKPKKVIILITSIFFGAFIGVIFITTRNILRGQISQKKFPT